MRGWSHVTTESVFPRSTRASGAALDLPGVAECRGYVQRWWGQGNPIPERSAQRILKAADQILKAGTVDRKTADQILKAGTDQGVRS